MTFVPLAGAPRPLAVPGRPTVVVTFASWCHVCIQDAANPFGICEISRSRRLSRHRLQRSAHRRQATRRAVRHPFPGGFDVPRAQPPPAGKTRKIVLPDTITAQQVLSLKTQLAPADYQKFDDVYRARSTMTPEQFHAYEQWMGVSFEDPKKIAAQRDRSAVLGLPHTLISTAAAPSQNSGRLRSFQRSRSDCAGRARNPLGGHRFLRRYRKREFAANVVEADVDGVAVGHVAGQSFGRGGVLTPLIIRLSGRLHSSIAQLTLTTCRFAASESTRTIRRSANRLRRRWSWISTISSSCASLRA